MAEKAKIVVFGCKHTTEFLIRSLYEGGRKVDAVVTISPELGARAKVADYCDMREFCRDYSIPCYSAESYSLKNEEDQRNIADLGGRIGLVIGWQRLIPQSVLDSFPVGVFGMHGSADDLPRGRGRSPMNWALIEGRDHFYTNLFKYDAGIDSGDIVDTFVFSLRPGDTAETMHYKNVLAMKKLVLKNLPFLENGEVELSSQPDEESTFYPKRRPENSIIDWERDIFQIEAHIRAVTRPFNGAFTFCYCPSPTGESGTQKSHAPGPEAQEEAVKIIIYRAEIFETDLVDFGYRRYRIGEVLERFPSGKFLVRCRGGILIVHEYEPADLEPAGRGAAEAETGKQSSLQPGFILYSPRELIKTFYVNARGYHDLPKV